MNRSYRAGLASLACVCVIGVAGRIVSATAGGMVTAPAPKIAVDTDGNTHDCVPMWLETTDYFLDVVSTLPNHLGFPAQIEIRRIRPVYQTGRCRGLVRSALGYALRQKDALMRVLDDGRLHLENNRSERELRRVAVGRKSWLFVGSHDHGEAAGHVLSLVASARLHRLDPESYLRDLFRVLAHWPRDRYLELAPRYWAQTRARLDPAELAIEIGPLTVPPPLATAADEQVAASPRRRQTGFVQRDT